MSKHVAPVRWADALAGAVSSDERAEMERHAGECARCQRVRVRVQRASDTFPVLRQQAAPELGWDSVRARVHWAVSKAKRSHTDLPIASGRRWLFPIVATGALAAAGIGVFVFTHGKSAPAVATHVPETAVHAAPLTALVSRLSGDVMIDGAHPDANAAFQAPLGAGTVLATGDGRIDLQFGDASAFALGPHSTLELRSFDAETVALVVDGTIDLEVAPRAKNQRFYVVAGDRTIEVRGTRFAVKHDATGTLVSCQHGLVAVRTATSAASADLLVGTARKAFVPAGHASAEAHAVALTAEELTKLASTTPWSVPGWAGLVTHSAPLDISAPATHGAVRVDGVELGNAPFAMRAAPGRHNIETGDSTGHFHRAGWVDVGGARAQFEAMPLPTDNVPASGAIASRKHELSAGVDHARLRQCTRRLAKSGLLNTYVQIEITVDGAGAINVLNVVDTDLPADTAQCVHDALADVHFAAGAAATWRQKLTL